MSNVKRQRGLAARAAIEMMQSVVRAPSRADCIDVGLAYDCELARLIADRMVSLVRNTAASESTVLFARRVADAFIEQWSKDLVLPASLHSIDEYARGYLKCLCEEFRQPPSDEAQEASSAATESDFVDAETLEAFAIVVAAL